MSETTNGPGWPMRTVLIIGLIFLVPALVNYGIATFVGRPRAPQYPGVELNKIPVKDKEHRAKIMADHNVKMAAFRKQSALFANKAFWISLPLGIMALGAGIFRSLGDVGTGLAGAGLIIMGMSHISYHAGIGDAERFLSLFVGVAVLLLIARRRFYRRA